MHDQRIEPRPALGLKNRRHRSAIRGIGAKTVDRFGREGDEGASAQGFSCLRDSGAVSLDDRSSRARRAMRLCVHVGVRFCVGPVAGISSSGT